MPENCWKLRYISLRSVRYAYLDTREYLADALLAKRQVRVRFGQEMSKRGEPYLIVSCKIKKRDEACFLEAMSELCDRMLLLGHTDYGACCERVMNAITGENGHV